MTLGPVFFIQGCSPFLQFVLSVTLTQTRENSETTREGSGRQGLIASDSEPVPLPAMRTFHGGCC